VTAEIGLRVVHRRYVPHSHAHYGGNLVDGAYVLGLFGDAATELCIRSDGDEGLFAGYDSVEFTAAVQAGDVRVPGGSRARAVRRQGVRSAGCGRACPRNGRRALSGSAGPVQDRRGIGGLVLSADSQN
jgi:3-aminobutyryl-CoA ammonia-lyase